MLTYISKKYYFGHRPVISYQSVTQHFIYFNPRFHDVLCWGEEVRSNIDNFVIHWNWYSWYRSILFLVRPSLAILVYTVREHTICRAIPMLSLSHRSYLSLKGLYYRKVTLRGNIFHQVNSLSFVWRRYTNTQYSNFSMHNHITGRVYIWTITLTLINGL